MSYKPGTRQNDRIAMFCLFLGLPCNKEKCNPQVALLVLVQTTQLLCFNTVMSFRPCFHCMVQIGSGWGGRVRVG